MKFKYIILLSMFFLAFSCQKQQDAHNEHDHDDHGHGSETTVSVTLFENNLEAFVEYGELLKGNETGFLVHLTFLDNFKPVVSGKVTISLQNHDGDVFETTSSTPVRAGIFDIDVIAEKAGHYHGYLIVNENENRTVFNLGHIDVLAADNGHDGEHHEHSHAEEVGEPEVHTFEPITFLKEQQWKTDFGIQKAGFVNVKPTVQAIGEVKPHQAGYAEIVAPLEGILNVQHNKNMVVVGSRVKVGQKLATLCPPLGRENTWIERKQSFMRAQNEYNRALNLKKRQAISDRDFEEIEQNYLVEKSGYETLQNVFGVDENEDIHFFLKSPINGIVSSVDVHSGQTISPGQKLMSIVDPLTVWLQIDVYEKEFTKLHDLTGVSLSVPGVENILQYKGSRFKLLSLGSIVERDKRTIPVLVQLDNSDNILKIGQILPVELHTDKERSAMCVPKSALIDEDINTFVFVQHGGEEFEKRPVKAGIVFNDLVEITDGLDANERIVTTGAYLVNLASSNVQVGHGHVH